MLISLLLLVPLTAMALVLGLGKLEDSLLSAPAVLADGAPGATAPSTPAR